MLTRIRNAVQVRHESVVVPASKTKETLVQLMAREGFLSGYKRVPQKPQDQLSINLRYYENQEPVISGLKRVSKPGLRVYVGHKEIPRYYGGLGVAFLSTPKGILTGRDAWRQGLGGELLLYIW